MKKRFKVLAAVLAGAMCLTAFAACSSGTKDNGTSNTGNTQQQTDNGGGNTGTDSGAGNADSGKTAVVDDGRKYTIGVIPFADTAAEQIDWNDYLKKYVGPQLNIDFKFVPAPGTDADAAVKVVEELKLAGCQGILGIIDTPAAIEKAEELGMWYARSGGLAALSDYEPVKNLPHYLGSFGPALEDEYQAGYDMTKYFVAQGAKDILINGFLLGLYIPSDMHIQRLAGATDALTELVAVYTPPESGSVVTGPGVGSFESGTSGLNITTIYGIANAEYMDATFNERFTTACSGKKFDVAIFGNDLNTLLTGVGITGVKSGEVDSFNTVAQSNMEAGYTAYLVGKYPSSVGPAVAALMNAIDGNADIVKNADGTGSRLQGPFWTATSADDFKVKRAFDNFDDPAYNKALITQNVKRLNPDLTREDFAKFASYGYDELKALH